MDFSFLQKYIQLTHYALELTILLPWLPNMFTSWEKASQTRAATILKNLLPVWGVASRWRTWGDLCYNMGKSCIAGGCTNTHRQGVSLFRFPSDDRLRKKWTRQIQRTRAKWKGPTPYSYVCSKHFTEDCFEPLSGKLGIQMKKMLKPGAVPTVFPKPSDSMTQKTQIYSTVCDKLEVARVSNTSV